MNDRMKLDKKIEEARKSNNNGENLYLNGLYEVNRALAEQKFPLSNNLSNAVNQNINDIRNGTGSLPTYHGREVTALTTTGVKLLATGNIYDGTVNLLGAGLNTAAFFVGGAVEAQKQKIGHVVGGPAGNGRWNR